MAATNPELAYFAALSGFLKDVQQIGADPTAARGVAQGELAGLVDALIVFYGRVVSLHPPSSSRESHERLSEAIREEIGILHELENPLESAPGPPALELCLDRAGQALRELATSARLHGITFDANSSTRSIGYR